jgi:hypothetical protein
MIFAAIEPPQYIVVPPTGGKMIAMVYISQSIQNDQKPRPDSLFKNE